tara:strand:+ start:70 stop:873 length:804 start_codon:yes stop_codon:yes gene_type:complete
MSDLRVLSLGAGVQSTTLALMIEHGEIPMVDCGIFADTMSEPKKVYEHLDWLEKQVSFPIYRVSKGNLKEDTIKAIENNIRVAMSPFFTRNKDTGKKGIMMRQCTQDYKIQPLIKKIRELLGVGYRKKVPKDKKVTQIFGISYDEMARMRQSPLKYISYEYPLVTKQMRRHNCLEWIEQKGYPKPPRSACFFCPYHSNEEWRIVKQNQEEWNEAVNLDYKIRNGFKNVKDELFLHKSVVPLEQAELNPNKDQQDLFNDICDSAMCGV